MRRVASECARGALTMVFAVAISATCANGAGKLTLSCGCGPQKPNPDWDEEMCEGNFAVIVDQAGGVVVDNHGPFANAPVKAEIAPQAIRATREVECTNGSAGGYCGQGLTLSIDRRKGSYERVSWTYQFNGMKHVVGEAGVCATADGHREF